MSLPVVFRIGLAAVALSILAAVPALAQSSGTATNVMFPINIMSAPQGGGGGGAAAGFQDRVRTIERNAPNRESFTLIGLDSSHGSGHFNAIFGGIPEGAGLSGGLQITTGKSIDNLEIYGAMAFSIRKYQLYEVGAVVSPGGEGWGGDVRFRYLERPKDNFFGVGPESMIETGVNPATGGIFGGETNYFVEQRSFAGTLHYDFTKALDIGVYVEHKSHSFDEGDDDDDISVFRLYQPYFHGAVPRQIDPLGAPPLVPGLGDSRYISFGAYLEYDKRNNDEGLTKGGYVYARVASHDSTGDADDPDFSDFGWVQTTFDLRGYVPLFGNRTSIAGRFFTDLNDRKGGSAIPFYSMPRLGGNSSLRGFDTFRFTGANAALFQLELRQTLKRFGDDDNRGLDVILFGDAGQVWGHGYEIPGGVTIPGYDLNFGEDFDSDNFEVDGGVGLGVRISKGFGVRFDYAHSNEDDKVRFVFSRGF